jgi:hypothetical protein
VRVKDVATVLGAAAGLPVVKRQFTGGRDGWAAEVEGVTVETTSVPHMLHLDFKAPQGQTLVDGMAWHYCSFHYEYERSDGRLLMPRSNAFWVAIGKRLVDFFGGTVDYNDCDDVEVDYQRPKKSRKLNAPTSGAEWTAFQERLLAVKPLSAKELENAYRPQRRRATV